MAARVEAERDGIQVPLTLEDYCIKTQVNSLLKVQDNFIT